MLDADRHALSAQVYHSALNIKEKEMNNLTRYLASLGTQAALLFGFGVSFIDELPSDTPPWLQAVYYILAVVCLGAEMYCVVTSTLCNVLGPTMALNGSRGSMHSAVSSMYEEREWIWHSFIVGAVAFSFDMLIYLWIILSQYGDPADLGVAAVCSVLCIACGVVICIAAKRIFDRFHLDGSSSAGKTEVRGVDFLKSQKAASEVTSVTSKAKIAER